MELLELGKFIIDMLHADWYLTTSLNLRKTMKKIGFLAGNTSGIDGSQQHKGSITRKALVTTAVSISVVIIASTGIAYRQLISNVTNETLTQVEKYSRLRAEREQAIFRLAEDNHVLLKKALLIELEKKSRSQQ